MKKSHTIKNPEVEIAEKNTQIKYLDKKLQKTWNQLNDIGCEIDNPFALNFIIINKKANKLYNRLEDIYKYVTYNNNISKEEKEKILKCTGLNK